MRALFFLAWFVCFNAEAKLREPCPENARYWCEDGTCAKNYLDCLSDPCPEPLVVQCEDGSCVEHEEECVGYQQECTVEKNANNSKCNLEDEDYSIKAGIGISPDVPRKGLRLLK